MFLTEIACLLGIAGLSYSALLAPRDLRSNCGVSSSLLRLAPSLILSDWSYLCASYYVKNKREYRDLPHH